jgi:hypothetical protein
MIDIPLNAKVECKDGSAGVSTALIIDPIKNQLTHFVIEDINSPLPIERLVPIEFIDETSRDKIILSCTLHELSEMTPYKKEHYIALEAKEDGDELYSPFVLSRTETILETVEEERIPPGELAVHRGTNVEAIDGYVGKVGELLLDSESGQITHLVMMAGHILGKKEITIPISAIDHKDESTVYLNIDKKVIESLPTIHIHRPWKDKTTD